MSISSLKINVNIVFITKKQVTRKDVYSCQYEGFRYLLNVILEAPQIVSLDIFISYLCKYQF